MTKMQKGQCHCSAVEIEFPKDINFKFSCHCKSCQKLVGSGRLLGALIPSDSIKVTGEVAHYSYEGGSGKEIILSFCPKCSTQMFANATVMEDTIVVRSNALENSRDFVPSKVLFPENACDWDMQLLELWNDKQDKKR